MYAYESDIKRINERLDIIEEALNNNVNVVSARERIRLQKKEACMQGNHAWKQIAYDLQGGKWGTDKCQNCPAERHWSFQGSGFKETIKNEKQN